MSDVKKIVVKGKIEVTRVYASDFQKEGSETAELKQTEETTTLYPSKTVTSSLQDNVFGTEEFGYEDKPYVSNRVNVAWINVPVGTTVEQVAARIAAKPKASLYRVVANHPILTDNQEYAINANIATMDQFADRQIVRHGSDDEGGKWAKGDLVLDNLGRPLYKAVFFSLDSKEDINRCTTDPGDFYVSETIKAEMIDATMVESSQAV